MGIGMDTNTININDYVYCTLTAHGLSQITRRGYAPKFLQSGELEIQLWVLMSELGDALFNGSEQSIVDNRLKLSPTKATEY